MDEKCSFRRYQFSLYKSVILIVLLMMLLSSSAVAQENETISVVISNFPPMTFIDDNGIYTGFSVELIDHIAMTEGWKVEYTLLPWADCLESVKNGDADLLIAAGYTKERDVYLNYTNNSISSEWSQVFTPENSDINSIRDLEGKKIALIENSFAASKFPDLLSQYHINCELIYVDDFKSVVSLLHEDEVDAGLLARSYAAHNDLGLMFRETAIEIYPTSLHCATTAGQNREIIETIDVYLNELKSDNQSVYYELEDKWFSYKQPYELPFQVWYVLLMLVLIIMAFVGISVILNKKVSRRKSELKSRNEELIASNQKYLTLVEESKDGIIIIQDGLLVFANRRISEMLGYDLDDIFKSHLADYVSEEDKVSLKEIYEMNIAGNYTNIPAHETHLVRKDGSQFIAALIPSLIDHEGKKAMMVIIRDIEEQKQAERLKEEIIRAEEAERAKNNFLANMSHELRTPLNSVIGFSEMLLTQVPGKLNDKQHQYVDNILTSGKHLLSLINAILDLSKIGTGKIELCTESFSPLPVIRETADNLMSVAVKKNLTFSYNVDNCNKNINADRLKFVSSLKMRVS